MKTPRGLISMIVQKCRGVKGIVCELILIGTDFTGLSQVTNIGR